MISLDKEYTTRDGRPVRILDISLNEKYPVVAKIYNGIAVKLQLYSMDGYALIDTYNSFNDNLIEKKKKVVKYAVVLDPRKLHLGDLADTPSQADQMYSVSTHPIATITWEE